MKIRTNLIPFTFTVDEQEIPFVVDISRRSDREMYKPLLRDEYPQEFYDANRKRLDNLSRLYTKFTETDDVNFRTNIQLSKSPNFALHYARFIILRYFEKIDGVVVSNDFIKNISIRLPAKVQKDNSFKQYYDFTIKLQHARLTPGFEMIVTYDGESRVYTKPISSLISIDKEHFSKVVYQGRTYKYEDATAPFQQNPSEAYPVINKDLENDLRLTPLNRPTGNKYVRVQKMADGFCSRYFFKGQLDEWIIIPRTNSFYEYPDSSVCKLPLSANNLLFKDWKGNEKTDSDIVHGFKNIGPYAKANIPGLKIFFIYQKDSGEKARDFLLKALADGAIDASFVNEQGKTVEYKRIRSLAKSIKHTFSYDNDGDISFSGLDSAASEIEKKLASKSFDRNNFSYLAIYVSPIGKESWDSQYRQIVYAKIKETCINYSVTVQGFYQDRINDGDSMQYYFTNIQAAILAKIGGIPWKIQTNTPEDLIIGVGAFYSRKKGKRYLGSAFCFDSTGIMREFSCIHEKDRNDLIAKIKQALIGFIQNNGGTVPKRIIIHFYKELGIDDWKPIFEMLNNIGIQEIPVIVATLGKTETRDILGFDVSSSDLMPLAGTYLKVDELTWLLYNNTKTNQKDWDAMVNAKTGTPGESKIPYHFPIKVRLDCRNSNALNETKTVTDVIQQIFQLSRMYWKSVDQQNLPITIKYPSILTEFLPYFTDEIIPNPAFGCKSLWFL